MELRALAYCHRVAIAVSECRKAVTGWITFDPRLD
jgi:hypothetical protein